MAEHDGDAAVCLLSAGLDSTVALALEKEARPVLLALTVDYGQRARVREIAAARALAAHFEVRHEVVELSFFRGIPAGALLDERSPLPAPAAEDLDGAAALDRAAAVWVPNRNGVFLQVAAAYAEALGAGRVVTGFNREEAATFPDNTEQFLEATSSALSWSTRRGVRAVSPTVGMDKAEIVREAVRRGVPLHLLWPCYEGGEKPCGVCESCRRFQRAARRAGVVLP